MFNEDVLIYDYNCHLLPNIQINYQSSLYSVNFLVHNNLTQADFVEFDDFPLVVTEKAFDALQKHH